MAIIHASGAGVALQLDMTDHPASPEPPARLKLARTGDGSRGQALDDGVVQDRIGRTGCPVEVDHYIIPGTGGHGRARADGLLAVARAFGCRIAVFGYDATRNDKFLVMTGTRSALDSLEILLPSVAVRMEQAARAAVNAYTNRVRDALPQMNGASQRRVLVTPYFRSFLRGYGFAVAEKIRTLRAETIKAEGIELARILTAEQARIDDLFNRDFPDRQPLWTERSGHRAGVAAGRKAGRSADFGDNYLATHDLVFAML